MFNGVNVQDKDSIRPVGNSRLRSTNSDASIETDSPDDRFEGALKALTAISAPSSSNEDFFDVCVEHMAKAYDARYAFICLFDDPETRTHIRTIATYEDGRHVPNITYPLLGSPCQEVLYSGKVFVANGLAARYPDDDLLVEQGLESYFGAALKDPNGESIGLLVVTDTKAMALDGWIFPLLDLFSDRISFELERARSDQQLRLSASVFQGCRDGILIMSPQWNVLSVNQSFESITGWTESEIFDQHVFVLRSDRENDAFFHEQTRHLLKTGAWEHELWIRHRAGRVFPADCSIKAVRDPLSGETSHYVMMLVDISEQKYAEQRIHRLAYFDPITELANRTHFQERLNQTLGERRNTQATFCVMLLDLDGFKAVNDRLGHAAGDQLLTIVAERLQTLPANEFFCARLGGDEFAILHLPDNRGSETGACPNSVAAEIVKLVSMPYDLSGQIATVTTSVGIASYPAHGDDAQSLIRNADLATYHAKARGRNRFEHFHYSLCEKAEKAAVLHSLLYDAVERKQFFMVYQSRHSADDGAIIGAEALIRWQLDDGTFVSPAQFIPIAEETGLVNSIGEWVLATVFGQVVEWERTGIEFGQVSINISGRQVLDPAFPAMLAGLVEETNLNPKRIELEITETWLMEDPQRSIALLSELKAMGFSLAIDDFGVAYSSMNYLRHFPVDILKIDRCFTRDINAEENSLKIISAIVAMGHSLGLKVLAEGVETEDQLVTLQTIGCDEYQGFFFSKPVVPGAFVEPLLKGRIESNKALSVVM